ncbi:thiol-specific monooxygenase [Fusarium tjaetaba]|uniref:Thiol-specific monooxygenase n=1 Tax=Fusarium tjaetaba TaxID=1567544 RepID=A0A8H5QN56_9HYPO|nr:thiol-specific monooxygenase [Fusarium tjaetaba]KAF5616776.1 thiol-specific monooxygenase [Fusarium tjaetaba]
MAATDDPVALVAKANARGPTTGFTDVDDNAEPLPAGFDTKNAKIFTPLKVGDLTLQHRVVHAALGRSRAAHSTESPLAVKYFEQRTTPGALMISQATGVSLKSKAWPWSATLETKEHQAAVADIIQVVHKKGGFWFQQLTHVGRCTSPGLVKHAHKEAGLGPPSYGYLPVSSSAVAETGVNTHSGEPFGVPHALTVEEIKEILADFQRAAALAVEAGADGVEILSGNGFLLDQFLHDNINQRDDQYGGSVENRSRFPLEVVDAIAEVVGYQRLGVRVSPFSNFHETDGSQPLVQLLHLSRELARRGIAYLHVGEGRVSRNLGIAENLSRLVAKGIAPEDISLRPFRRLLRDTAPSNSRHTPTVLVGNGGYTATSGILTVQDDLADADNHSVHTTATPFIPGYTSYSNFEEYEGNKSQAGHSDRPDTDESKAIRQDGANDAAKNSRETPNKRVAIIGAGISGTVTAAAFQRLGGFELQIFERKSVPGGVWVYDPVSTTIPQFPAAEPSDINPPLPRPNSPFPLDLPRSTQQCFLSSPIYDSLEANIPYKVMGGATDFNLPPPANNEHYLSVSEVTDFVAKATQKYSSITQFSTTVEDVQNLPQGGVRLLLRQENANGTDTWYEEDFDHLVVATGHNSVPRVPKIPGHETWKGDLQHASTWRSGQEFKDKSILVIGTSESAIDLVLQSLPHVRGDIHVCQRTPHPRCPNVFDRPGVKLVTTIDRFTENTIHLHDGSVLHGIDAVVFATGYFYTYSFLSNVRPPVGPGGHRVPGLYQHIFDIHNPSTIAFVGVVNASLTWLTWEKSAFLVALFWSGRIKLPSREAQEAWEADRLAEKGEDMFHVLELPYERVLFFDQLNELAAEYLQQESADDTLLRGFPFEFILALIAGRPAKLKKYDLVEDVGGRGVIGPAILDTVK